MYGSRAIGDEQKKDKTITLYCDYSNFGFLKLTKLGQKGKIKISASIISEDLNNNDDVSKRARVDKIELEKERSANA